MIDATPDYAGRDTIKGTQWRHPDARVERVRRHVCEGALLQAIGRARGIPRTADNPVVIELWTDVPLAELGPVEPQVWGHIAPTLDAVMLATHGVVMSNTVHAANLAPEIVGSGETLKKARQREVRDIPVLESSRVQKCPAPPDLLPPDPSKVALDRVRYRLPGPGQKVHSMVRFPSLTSPSSAWLADHFECELAYFERLPWDAG